MSIAILIRIIYCALSFSLVAASSPLDSNVHVRTPPGASEDNVVQAIRREMRVAAVNKRDREYKVNTTLDRSWDDATLLSFGATQQLRNTSLMLSEKVEIVCTTCYIKGAATGELSFANDFNASQAIEQAEENIEGDVHNFTSTAETYFKDYVEGVLKKLGHGVHLADFELPTFPYNFDMNITSIPEANLHFTFDQLELYMLLDTTLSLGATYTHNLYSSNTPLGIWITDNLELGVIFAIDLILDADGMIDISTGFHLKLEDDLAIDIAMFAKDVSGITFNGGHFEFLPVNVESAGAVFTATLRVGVHAGFNLHTPDSDLITLFNTSIPSVAGGIEVGVFANIAEFTTNLTVQPEAEHCDIGVVQSYQFALGAAAGATIAIETHTWGPVAQTSVPIWYTELDAACATRSRPTATPTSNVSITARAERRQAMMTVTTTSIVTYTGVNCLSTGIVNCPASLQNTSQSTATTTLTTVVPFGSDGSDITFSPSVQSTVSTTVAFGVNAVSLSATTGSPISYIPPPPTSTGKNITSIVTGIVHHEVTGTDKKIIIGVCVGVGTPILLVIIVAIILHQKKRRIYAAVPKTETVTMVAEPYGHNGFTVYHDKPRKTGVSVEEVQREGSWRCSS